MAVTRLSSSWLGYDEDNDKLVFWDGRRFRPLEEAVGYAPAVHNHGAGDITAGIFDVARIPDLSIAKITGLQTALDGKLSLGGGTLTGNLVLPLLQLHASSQLTGDANGLYIAGSKVNTDGNRPTGILRQTQTFIAGGTWTKSTGIKRVLAFVWGGGGGGGGAQGGTSNGACGAGGGAGGFGWKMIDVSAISSVTVTIGAGGTAGANTGGNGGTGGTTSFGAHISATGGVGGTGQTSGNFGQIVAGGSGGSASSGDFNVTGSPGSPGIRLDFQNGIAGRGAPAAWLAGGGNGFAGNSAGQDGFARGDGGGGGVVANNATGRAGGVGSTGMVWVWEFE